MVRLLLDYGADPNQPVYLNEGRTVWELFLISCHKSMSYTGGVSASLTEARYLACKLLIYNGAQCNRQLSSYSPAMAVHSKLESLFGTQKAGRQKELVEDKARSSSALM
jgi:hypothetical protein